MAHTIAQGDFPEQPTLAELGQDLLCVTPLQRLITLTLPFAAMGGYALFAWLHWWLLAVVSVMGPPFVTYGSSYPQTRRARWLHPRGPARSRPRPGGGAFGASPHSALKPSISRAARLMGLGWNPARRCYLMCRPLLGSHRAMQSG